MKTLKIAAPVALLLALLALAVHAGVPTADLKDAQDSPLVKRYEGSLIIAYKQKAYDQYALPLGKVMERHKYENSELVEGRLTRLSYLGPEGRSAVEIFRNYMQELKGSGFEI